MRIAIDVSPDEHRKIKTLASYNGLSIKDFVLSKVFTKKNESSCSLGDKDHIPNKKTAKALQDSLDKPDDAEIFENTEQLFESWDKELAEK